MITEQEVLQYALAYHAAGFSVVPVSADSKHPSGFRWGNYMDRIASEEEIHGWFGEERAELFRGEKLGIGIVCGKVSGNLECMDFDSDAERVFRLWRDAVQERAPDLIDKLTIDQTPRPGYHVWYRTESVWGSKHLATTGDTKKGSLLIEVKEEGKLALAVGCPEFCSKSGRLYQHIGGPALVDVQRITDEERFILHEEAMRLGVQVEIGEEKRERQEIARFAGDGLLPGDDFDLRGDWSDILTGWIVVRRAGEASYWRRPGKDEGWSATTGFVRHPKTGASMLRVFTTSAPPLEPRAYTKFQAYALIHHNRNFAEAAADLARRGYGDRSRAVLGDVDLSRFMVSVQEAGDHYLANQTLPDCVPAEPIAVDSASELESDEPFDPNRFPAECLKIPGLIGDILDYNLSTARYPQPELGLGGVLALMSTITGRKIKDHQGTRTNLYILGLDHSGAGKEHARKINKDILIGAQADHIHLGPESIGSSQGATRCLEKNASLLFQLDEIGRLLLTVKNSAKNSPYLFNVSTVFLKWYTSSDKVWTGDATVDVDRIPRIDQPHAVIYGTNVPTGFWDAIDQNSIHEGLIGRFLVFEGRGYQKPNHDFVPAPVPDSILDRVKWWANLMPNLNQHNSPTQYTVTYEPDAWKRFTEHQEAVCEKRIREDTARAAIWSRHAEKTAKLALIFAASRCTGLDFSVGFQDVDLAIKVNNWCTRKLILRAFQFVAENPVEANTKKVKRIIGSQIDFSALTRKTQWLRSRERQEILNDLVSSGDYEVGEISTSGRTKKIIFKIDKRKQT